MEFKQFAPSTSLKSYVDSFYLFQSENDSEFNDVVFPSGTMEIIFNLGPGIWESEHKSKFKKTPSVELWGQVTGPLAIRSKGKHLMLGVRFFSHSAAYFLNDEIGEFNDRIFDLSDVVGQEVKLLHTRLLETSDTAERIVLIEDFLIARLAVTRKNITATEKIACILRSIRRNSPEDGVGAVASSFGITPRYLHKLTYQYTGLSPTSLSKISRFQSSLKLMSKSDTPFTSIALNCGYFDQSHFIRDFKSFTGFTPSAYLGNKLPINDVTRLAMNP